MQAQIYFLKSPALFSLKSITDIKKTPSSEFHINPQHLNDFDIERIYYAKSNCNDGCKRGSHQHLDFSECRIVKLKDMSQEALKSQPLVRRPSSRIKKPKVITDLGTLTASNASKKVSGRNKDKVEQTYALSRSVLKSIEKDNTTHNLLQCKTPPSINDKNQENSSYIQKDVNGLYKSANKPQVSLSNVINVNPRVVLRTLNPNQIHGLRTPSRTNTGRFASTLNSRKSPSKNRSRTPSVEKEEPQLQRQDTLQSPFDLQNFESYEDQPIKRNTSHSPSKTPRGSRQLSQNSPGSDTGGSKSHTPTGRYLCSPKKGFHKFRERSSRSRSRDRSRSPEDPIRDRSFDTSRKWGSRWFGSRSRQSSPVINRSRSRTPEHRYLHSPENYVGQSHERLGRSNHYSYIDRNSPRIHPVPVNNGQNHARFRNGSRQSPHDNSENDEDLATIRSIFYDSHDVAVDFKGRGDSQKFITASIDYYYLTDEGKEEKSRRYTYDPAIHRVYLGEGITVPSTNWLMIQNEKPEEFIRTVAVYVWKTPEVLANRALQLSRVHTSLPNRSPRKRIEKVKLRLLISLLDDFLENKKNIPFDTKLSVMKNVTVTLSLKIRDCRNEVIRDYEREMKKRNRQNNQAKRRLDLAV